MFCLTSVDKKIWSVIQRFFLFIPIILLVPQPDKFITEMLLNCSTSLSFSHPASESGYTEGITSETLRLCNHQLMFSCFWFFRGAGACLRRKWGGSRKMPAYCCPHKHVTTQFITCGHAYSQVEWYRIHYFWNIQLLKNYTWA